MAAVVGALATSAGWEVGTRCKVGRPVRVTLALARYPQVICDLGEGPAPYRPRYTMPDYAKALQEGSRCHTSLTHILVCWFAARPP